jgi:hypothetical protein
MRTERENFFKMLRREDPDFVSYQPDLLQMVLPSALQDRPASHRTGYDWFGVHWSEDADMPGMLVATAGQKPVLEDINDWESVIKWPDLAAIDWAACAKHDVPQKDMSKILCAMLVSGPFERLHDLMGFENALCALITDPEACGAFFSRLCDFKIEQLRYLKKNYDLDMVHFQDDWGNQKDLFFDPVFWRQHIMPHVKRVIDAAHDLGMCFDMHSCGRIDRIIDDIIDLGVDVIDPVQPVNDMAGWVSRFGRNVIFMGGLNAQEVIDYPTATDEDIRREAEAKIDLFAKTGYYIPFAVSLSPRVKDALAYGYIYGKTYYKPQEYAAAVEAFKASLSQPAAAPAGFSIVPGTNTTV